jgi:hypothetical protein
LHRGIAVRIDRPGGNGDFGRFLDARADQLGFNDLLDGSLRRHRPDGGRSGAGGDRVAHVGIGEEQCAELGRADDEADEDGSEQAELGRADSALVAAQFPDAHHGTLTLPDAAMVVAPRKYSPWKVFSMWIFR